MHEIDLMLKLQLEGKNEEARVLSDKLEAIGPEKILDPTGKNTQDIWMRHCFNRGWFLIQQGDYQAGSKLLENGRFLSVYGSPPLRTDAPIYNPSEHDIKGKSIIISLEGGFGDEIIHARFATSFKNKGADKVYLAAAPELVSVLGRVEGVDKVILRNQANTVQHDYWVPGFSSGWIAGHTFDDFPGKPYLTPLDDSTEVWKDIIKSDKLKVGIRWAGNPKFEHQQFRRFPENFITNLAKYPELQIYSFQKDHNLVELPENIVDLQNLLLSWEDTAAAIANIDIMITSCTSVAHLAAAMGKETWVITPILPYHTWTYKSPEATTSPYYDVVKIYRQKEKSKWDETFQQLYSDLEEKFNLAHIDMPNEDREIKKLNLGCGQLKIEDFTNVDINEKVKPDIVVDLNQFPWPFKDNEFDHVVAKDILQYLGETPKDLVKVIKELYRITHNGGVWEIQAPHWRSDNAVADPTIVSTITPGVLNLFSKRIITQKLLDGTQPYSESTLAFDHDVDIEIVDMQFEYNPVVQEKIRTKKMNQDELTFAMIHYNNVALSTRFLVQVHKPGRNDYSEFDSLVEKRLEFKVKLKPMDMSVTSPISATAKSHSTNQTNYINKANNTNVSNDPTDASHYSRDTGQIK